MVASRLVSFVVDIPKAGECRSKRFAINRTQASYQPLFIENAQLIQRIRPLFFWKLTGIRKGAGRLPVVIGATIGVRR
jgi:hypothetical protein